MDLHSTALDILLYQSAYREHISNIVLAESNRIYNLFRERNPDFKGKVSLVGHSLGSAIYFDILCRQKEMPKLYGMGSEAHQRHAKHKQAAPNKHSTKGLDFDFEVEDFYCLGSPIGLCPFSSLLATEFTSCVVVSAVCTHTPISDLLLEHIYYRLHLRRIILSVSLSVPNILEIMI
jgi:hypothetical protein